MAAEPTADYVAVFDGWGWGTCDGPALAYSCLTGAVSPTRCVLVNRADPTWFGGWCSVLLVGRTSGVRVDAVCVMTGAGRLVIRWSPDSSERPWVDRDVALRSNGATMTITGDRAAAVMTLGCGGYRTSDTWRGEVVL